MPAIMLCNNIALTDRLGHIVLFRSGSNKAFRKRSLSIKLQVKAFINAQLIE
jgi:hypothetical protein